MNPLHAYRQQTVSTAWTRVDMVLALLRGSIDTIQKAKTTREEGDLIASQTLLLRGQALVLELVGGIIPGTENEVLVNLQRLYEFVLHCLTLGEIDNMDSAVGVLQNIQSAYEAIRDEAAALEKSGQIPSAYSNLMVEALG